MIVPLTDRELVCLEGLARGLSYQEIGAELYLSQWTVKLSIKRLFRQLGARNGPHAISIAYQKGLLTA